MAFIPAKESRLFSRLFRIYIKWLFKRRFHAIWIRQQYIPEGASRTVYFLNHTSWWDGLIPFLLNEYRFKQQARAFMEHRQMKTYPFFRWLGAFSAEPGNPSHNLRSLRYALRSMHRPQSSLFIYPQGAISPVADTLVFKDGIGWLRNRLPHVDFVPIGIHIHTIRHDRPELHIAIGEKVTFPPDPGVIQAGQCCREALNDLMPHLIKTAGFNDGPYTQFW